MQNSTFNKELPIVIGGDHAGFKYKSIIIDMLKEAGWQVEDKGTYSEDSTDYPDYAHPTAAMVESGAAAAGILICGSGNGVCMTANKHQGVRAALCWNEELTALARQHNNANVLCIPARFVPIEVARDMTDVFLSTLLKAEGTKEELRK